MVVVNVLPVEWYLRGVVPLEIGTRTASEEAAVEAQAIAARKGYTMVRLASVESGGQARNASYDLLSSVGDQVYGGADAERPFSNQAVARTVGLVLKYNDKVINAPYHSTCGGETAEPDEVWRSSNEPFLLRVSDRIPGTADRYYCDISPRFAWTRSMTGEELDAAVRTYLASYATVPSGGAGEMCVTRRSSRARQAAVWARRSSSRRRGGILRCAGTTHPVCAAQPRWRDPQQHLFFGADGNQPRRASRTADREGEWLRPRNRHVSVGRDRTGARDRSGALHAWDVLSRNFQWG